jgi:3-phenylpropionate/trans-cinnamate dioxygenase ferredoxin reductase subunit
VQRIVVVGASLGGLSAASAIVDAGFDGEVVVLGEERHHPYDRPPLSKGFLAGEEDRDAIRLDVPDGVQLRLGRRAIALDLEGGTVVHAEAPGPRGGQAAEPSTPSEVEHEAFSGLVIATGARPRTLPVFASLGPDAGVHLLRTLDDAEAIRATLDQGASRVALVGAGFIGTEVAATCRSLGLEVSIIEPDLLPLRSRVGKIASTWLFRAHEAKGVSLLLGRTVASVDAGADGRVRSLRLDNGTSVGSDVVVVGVGVSPSLEWLTGSGIVLQDGVTADECGFVPGTDGRVVAVGDIARAPRPRAPWEQGGSAPERIEHWDHAVTQGSLGGANLLVGPSAARPWSGPGYFWSDQYGRKLQLVGRPEPEDDELLLEGSTDSDRFAVGFARGGRLVAVVTVGWAAALARWQRRLGERVDDFD